MSPLNPDPRVPPNRLECPTVVGFGGGSSTLIKPHYKLLLSGESRGKENGKSNENWDYTVVCRDKGYMKQALYVSNQIQCGMRISANLHTVRGFRVGGLEVPKPQTLNMEVPVRAWVSSDLSQWAEGGRTWRIFTLHA